jgi:hypothetical protein
VSDTISNRPVRMVVSFRIVHHLFMISPEKGDDTLVG